MPRVHFQTERVTVDVPENTTLREVALQQGIGLYRGMWTHFNCAGNGICGRCQIWIISEGKHVSVPSVRERVHRVKGRQRLACQVKVLGEVVVRTRPIGPAVVSMNAPGSTLGIPSYGEAAERRHLEALEEEQQKADLAAKKARAEEKKKTEEAARAATEAEEKKKTEEAARAATEAEENKKAEEAARAAAQPATTDDATTNGATAEAEAKGADEAAAR